MPERQLPTDHAPFEVVAGVGIGPFRLGMTEAEILALCGTYGIRNEGVVRSGFLAEFRDGRAVRIEIEAVHPLSLAGQTLGYPSVDAVRRLIDRIAPGADWNEIEGLEISRYERSDDFVFSLAVFAPGHRR